jgi:hypothetical protein
VTLVSLSESFRGSELSVKVYWNKRRGRTSDGRGSTILLVPSAYSS